MKKAFGAFLAALLAFAVATVAWAHGRSTSYVTWTMQGAIATTRVKLALLDHNALLAAWNSAKPPRDAATAIPDSVWIGGEPGTCRIVAGSFHELAAEHGSIAFEWQTHCAAPDGTPFVPTTLRSGLLFDVIAAHVTLVRYHDESAGIEVEDVLTESRREVVLPERTSKPSDTTLVTILRFGRAGIEHLLTGWDHLAFLLALVLASRSIRVAIVCLTGFTLGHSLTLSLAVMGHAATKSDTVEALIAVSIVLVSIENIWMTEDRANLRIPLAGLGGVSLLLLIGSLGGTISPLAGGGLALFEVCFLALLVRADKPDQLRWICASLFGLLHGFGFAGMLGQMELPAGNRAVPLASFNIGIELAQVGVVCLAWPLLVLARKRFAETNVLGWGSAVTLAIGVYGCVTRLWG